MFYISYSTSHVKKDRTLWDGGDKEKCFLKMDQWKIIEDPCRKSTPKGKVFLPFVQSTTFIGSFSKTIG